MQTISQRNDTELCEPPAQSEVDDLYGRTQSDPNEVLWFRQRDTRLSQHLMGRTTRPDGEALVFGLEQPLHGNSEGIAVMANGFTGVAQSMARAACMATRWGAGGIPIAANHHNALHALDQYVQDVETVANRTGARRLLGLSMGGAAVLAAGLNSPRVESVMAVSPACFASGQVRQLFSRRGIYELEEIDRAIKKDPIGMLKHFIPMLLMATTRPITMGGELHDLLTKNVADEVAKYADQKTVTIAACKKDGLVDPKKLKKTAGELGIKVIEFPFTHLQMITDASATKLVVETMLKQGTK